MAGNSNLNANDNEEDATNNVDPSQPSEEASEDVKAEYDFLDSQLDELNSALDFLEQKNDDIHKKLKELLQSNRDIRQELQNGTMELDDSVQKK